MFRSTKSLGAAAALAAALVVSASPASAQGKGHDDSKHEEGKPAVTVDLAVSAAKDVLVKQGYEIVRVESKESYQVIYYRAGNHGRGKGQGPPARMVVRRVENRIVLEEAPDQLRVDIGIRLGIRL